ELLRLRGLRRLEGDELAEARERTGQGGPSLAPLREIERVAAVDVAAQARLELVDDPLELEGRRRDLLRMSLRVRRAAQVGYREERQREGRSDENGEDGASRQQAAEQRKGTPAA